MLLRDLNNRRFFTVAALSVCLSAPVAQAQTSPSRTKLLPRLVNLI